eukprot:3558378-Pyramimonas_sp.AAC.1
MREVRGSARKDRIFKNTPSVEKYNHWAFAEDWQTRSSLTAMPSSAKFRRVRLRQSWSNCKSVRKRQPGGG